MKTKSALIADIGGLVGAVVDQFRSDEGSDAERDFMAARCPQRLEPTIRSLPTLSLHLLAELAAGPISVVGLATRSGRLKGTVSKHVQRLVDAGLVRRSPIPGNRKEVELHVCDDGALVIEAHQRLHDEMDRGLDDFLAHYSAAELEIVSNVLRDLSKAHRVGVRIQHSE